MDTQPTVPSADPNAKQAETPTTAQPKKYIRTFAGDIKTVQEQGIPDLTPLVKAPPTALPTPAPPPPPQSRPAEPMSSPLETYAGDFSKRVGETRASTATILAAEQDSASRTPRPSPARGNRLYLIAGAVLLVAGAAGAYIAYTYYAAAGAPVVLAPAVSAPIFVDDREEISGTGDVLLQAIERSVARTLAPHAVRLLFMSLSTTTEQSVFSELSVSAPGVLVRNVSAKGSMAGVVNTGGEQSPFFILSVATYGNTLAGMLSWETVMPRALAGLFPAYPVSVPAGTATSTAAATTPMPKRGVPKANVATTTVAVAAPVFIAGFRDEVVANHDVRVYRDAAGKSVLLYGYWNQTTLVIARSPEAFTEILQRLATSRTQP